MKHEMTSARRTARVVAAVAVVVGVVAFAAVACPSTRLGADGMLERGRSDAASAMRSAALSLDAWQRGRATTNLVAVQIGDARDDVLEAYDAVAGLDAERPADVAWQRALGGAMNHALALLNATQAVVAHQPPSGESQRLGRELAAAAELPGPPP